MGENDQNDQAGALVPAGARIDHDDTLLSRKMRELAASFNRMGSDSDAEAHNAYDRARLLLKDLGLSFDAVFRASQQLSEFNTKIEKTEHLLRQALQENAHYRSHNILYKVKSHLVKILRGAYYSVYFSAPLAVIGVIFYLGYISAVGCSLLIIVAGLFNTARGLMKRNYGQIGFGLVLMLGSSIGFLVANNNDSPEVHRRMAQLIENMNRDNRLGPEVVYIDYPYSHRTLVMTVLGIKDTMKVTVDGVAQPLEISCAKYYEHSIILPEGKAHEAQTPEKPDIFHRVPAATFGSCDLYAELSKLH